MAAARSITVLDSTCTNSIFKSSQSIYLSHFINLSFSGEMLPLWTYHTTIRIVGAFVYTLLWAHILSSMYL